MRRGKDFTKAETTTLLKTIEHILPIDAEGWNKVHDLFNSKHTPRGVEGLKRKFNKLANKPVPTGNPNMPEDAKSIKGKLFCHSGATNLSEEEEEEENNSAIAVEASEEVTDMQAAVIAPPESSPTTAVQQGTPSLNRLAIAAAQSSLAIQCVLQTGIRHGATHDRILTYGTLLDVLW